jgi:hypothetical protein
MQPNDRNKFFPLDSPLAPFSIPAWSSGLQAVDQSPSRLLEASKAFIHYGHYTLPDPGLFITPVADKKATDKKAPVRYIEPWLRLRDTWLMRLAKEPSLAISNQHWRTFLAANLNAPADGRTKAANRIRTTLDLIIPQSDTYSGVKIRNSSKDPLVWQDKEYPPGVLPPESVVRQILWELYELNFIHELVSLDRRACAELDLSDTAQLLDRQTKISRCFPIESFRHVTIPSRNCGLAADNLGERFPFIVALFLVVKSWRGDQPKIFEASEENVRNFSGHTALSSFENLVAKYYCQQFFNYFGRAAQIPHRLFATKDN